MKFFQAIGLLLFFLLPAAASPQTATNLLPGVTYYDGPEKLTGKLVFLLNQDIRKQTNSVSAAAIYEFDLSSKALRKVTDSPAGGFNPSVQGDAFCVVYCPGVWFHDRETNAFIYVESSGLSRIVNLESRPNDQVIAGNHVFFELQGYNYTNSGGYMTKPGTDTATKILDFDIIQNQTHSMELSGASRWQYETYDRMHTPHGPGNVLHFYYNGVGKKVEQGKDYPDGFYSLDIRTGGIKRLSDLLGDEDDERYTLKTTDGRYIFFEGPEKTAPPRYGFKLVSSPWDDWHTAEEHAKSPKIKVLKKFPKPPVFNGSEYELHAISPDGKYAFVSFIESATKKTMEQSGYARTYYAVDLSNGSVRMLLKDDVDHSTCGSISGVSWVESRK